MTISGVFDGLWDNRAILEAMSDISDTTEVKKYDKTFFMALRRVLYVIGNMPKKNYPIKDLLCLAYADYLRAQLLESIDHDNNYLTIGLKEHQGLFIQDMDQIVNHFKNCRLIGIAQNEIQQDEFENMIDNNFRDRVNHHLKVKEMLGKYTIVENRMKKIFAEAMLIHLSEMNNAYKTSLPTTEQRHHAIRQYVRSPNFKAVAKKIFEQYFFQDDYFKVFREIYTSLTFE